MNKSIYSYISADCGAGKTNALIKQIKRTDDRYIVVQGTTKLVEQTTGNIGNVARMITSNNCSGSSVESDVHQFLLNPTHRALVITDKAFLQISDLSLLRNWKIYLDDVVEFYTYRTINTELKYQIEKNLFKDFESVTDKYVTAKQVTEYTDDLLRELHNNSFSFIRTYDNFIMNSNFFTKLGKVGELSADVYSNENNQLSICAWVDLSKYEGLDITFMANKFEESLIYKGNSDLFNKITMSELRTRVKPVEERLRVYYFSKTKKFTKTYRNENPDQIAKVIDYINSNVTDFYYTVSGDMSKNLKGTYITPVSRGLNTYQDYTTCVWLASMKPSPVEIAQINIMFGLTSTEIVQAREYENLYQFVNRSNIRDYASEQDVVVYVFDEEQARSLSSNPIFIDLRIDEEVKKSNFIPARLSDADNKRMSKITMKRFPDKEKFDTWMNSQVNSHMNELQREKFYKKFDRRK